MNNIRIGKIDLIKVIILKNKIIFWHQEFVDYLYPKFTLLIPEINVMDLIPLLVLERSIEIDKEDGSTEVIKKIQKGIFLLITCLSSKNEKNFFKEIKLKEGKYKICTEVSLNKNFNFIK